MSNRNCLGVLVVGLSLGLTGCDVIKDTFDSLDLTVDVTGKLKVSGDGEPDSRSVVLYAPEDNPDAFDPTDCGEGAGGADPTCFGRIDTSLLDTPVSTEGISWSGDEFTISDAALTTDLAFIAVLTASGGASCSTDVVGYNEETKLARLEDAVTLNLEELDPVDPEFELPRAGAIHCNAPIEAPEVMEPDEPETPEDGEDITGGDESTWLEFTIGDGTDSADASAGDVASADNPVACGGETAIAAVLSVNALCEGCGDVAYLRTQFGAGEDAIFTTAPVAVASDGSISAEFSLAGAYAVVQLDSDAELNGVGESFTITFCEEDDLPPQEFWGNLTWDVDDTDVDIWVTNNISGESVGWSSASSSWGSLDIDNTWGYGPENLKSTPDYVGGEYEVRLHYYYDYGNGPATATVRVVYLDPTTSTVCDVTSSTLLEPYAWWTVGMFGPGLACPN